MNNEKTFEDEVKRWMELGMKVEDLGMKIKGAREAGAAVEAEDSDTLIELICEQTVLGLQLREIVTDREIIDDITDPHVRGVVLQLMQKGVEEIDRELGDDPLEMDDEMQNEAWDLLYELTGGPKHLLLNHKRIQAIVALAEIPERLRELLEEAKICFATGQQNAVLALGRMMLETAVVDISERLGLEERRRNLKESYKDYPLYEKRNDLLGKGSDQWKTFKRLYDQGSKAIHSSPQSESSLAAEYLEQVIRFVGEVYTRNYCQLQK
ncbi:MAG: hypothetical protein AAF491_00080 [Verrucomicrobiota bacterium]